MTAHPLKLVKQAGHAVRLVIASEMDYLAENETEGEKEIVIELPPPSYPLPYALSYYICSAESHFLSAHRHMRIQMCTHSYKTNFPSPTQWPQQRVILMQGDFID